ncbi:MAG: MOSC domain-containing protein [Actinomycetota bacterium]
MIDVQRISVTPVKGTTLHHPDEIQIERFGVRGNRRFLFVDPRRTTYNAGRLGPLMGVRADVEGDSLTFTLPDGSSLCGAVHPGGEVVELDMWGRTLLVRRVPGPWDEAISSLVGLPLRLVEPVEPGDGNDDEPITLVSLASVAALATEAGADHVDAGRFRMTLDIDGVGAHEEDSWAGRRIRVGSAVLRVGDQVPRCVLTTWDPGSGDRDLDTLRIIRKYRGRTHDGLPFGMYASVIEPGVVRAGDEIRLLT